MPSSQFNELNILESVKRASVSKFEETTETFRRGQIEIELLICVFPRGWNR